MDTKAQFSAIFWNPSREAFVLPYFDHPVMWYGLLFVLGFALGYFIILKMFQTTLIALYPEKEKTSLQEAQKLADRLTWMVVLATLIGSRLGHVLFYDFDYYKNHLLEIFKVWQGGLASHGGTLGIMLSLVFYRLSIKKEYPELTIWRVFDLLTVPTCIAAVFIRLGNFINQEIVGTTTDLPWGVSFGNPLDISASSPDRHFPRHPVQLYEAAAYLLLFFIMRYLWKSKYTTWQPGKLFGIFLTLLFGSRFFLEFFKVSQGEIVQGSFLQTGQWLSLPFIAFGIALTLYKSKTNN